MSKMKKFSNIVLPMPIAAIGEGKKGGMETMMTMVEDDNTMNKTPKEGKDIIHDIGILIETIELIGEFRTTQRKESQSLVRRIKLIILLLDEIKQLDNKPDLLDIAFTPFSNLRRALLSAKKLLRTCSWASKIYLALECEAITNVFHSVNAKLSQAVDEIPYDALGISDEVKEQMELMGHQLKRAQKRTDTQDMELAMDMMVVFNKEDDRNADIAILQRLAKKLDLHTSEELSAETKAVKRLVKENKAEEHIQSIIEVLNKFYQIAGIENTGLIHEDVNMSDAPLSSNTSDCANKPTSTMEIPQEFLCPISFEIMTDPVIIPTGQTYERESILNWFESNHKTCPKTGQTLEHLSLAPNYALKNIISQWCDKNNFQLPSKPNNQPSHSQYDTTTTNEPFPPNHKENVISLIKDLSSSNETEIQREAAHQLRLLSKESPENRILIAQSQGIPPLVQVLSSPDPKIKEHAVTALLNLSINDTNKKVITEEEAIPAIVEVLVQGNAGAKENAAAALFSLSMLDENKVSVGMLNGVPALVDLLTNGTVRGKRDAATALFNLCLNHTNKARAVEAGIVKPLQKLLEDKELGMINESLSILLLLASHPQGRQELGQLTFIQKLVDFMGEDETTEKNKEGAAAVLYELGLNGGSSFLLAALQYGVYQHLVQITKTGTNRGRRKATSVLQLMRQYEQIP